jgi:hypothetical protein
MLEMPGFGANLPVTLHWQSPLPTDELAEAQTLVLHSDLGVVSRQTLATKLGYDYDAESKQIEGEKAADPQPVHLATPLNSTTPCTAATSCTCWGMASS